MFDNQTDIDLFLDQYVLGAINAGYDLVTDEKGARLLTTTDEFGNIEKGDYGKFMNYVFQGLEVPTEKQNFLGRVLMTAGEFVVPMGTLRTVSGKLGETVLDVITNYTKAQRKTMAKLGKKKRKRYVQGGRPSYTEETLFGWCNRCRTRG